MKITPSLLILGFLFLEVGCKNQSLSHKEANLNHSTPCLCESNDIKIQRPIAHLKSLISKEFSEFKEIYFAFHYRHHPQNYCVDLLCYNDRLRIFEVNFDLNTNSHNFLEKTIDSIEFNRDRIGNCFNHLCDLELNIDTCYKYSYSRSNVFQLAFFGHHSNNSTKVHCFFSEVTEANMMLENKYWIDFYQSFIKKYKKLSCDFFWPNEEGLLEEFRKLSGETGMLNLDKK